ncbi:MAG: flagellar basal body L-ring protein FlgH [Aquificaceae bacterium]|nr:flagellar basal body L-ring protein FlgH [Aquificaceae bacterium]
MGRLVVLLTFLIFSCGPKVSTLEEYERKNPYPSTEDRLEYASRGSLMPKNGFQDLYSERRASRVGDILFLQVVESINAVESVSSQTQRSSAFQQSISSFFGLSPNTLADIGGRGSGQLNTAGSGKLQQTGTLTTRLAGRVMRIYQNGTMLVEARKNIIMNNAQREVVLRGIVRPEDIDSTNTVTSDKIANLEVFIDGKGFLADGGSPGWLARILAKVLPF